MTQPISQLLSLDYPVVHSLKTGGIVPVVPTVGAAVSYRHQRSER